MKAQAEEAAKAATEIELLRLEVKDCQPDRFEWGLTGIVPSRPEEIGPDTEVAINRSPVRIFWRASIMSKAVCGISK